LQIRTDFNDNSSRFAKYLDVSFSKMGKVTGAKVSVFLLEHTRLLLAESEVSKNFHVFSLVYAGLESQGRLADFGLDKCSKFDGYSKTEVAKQVEEFGKLISAFRLIGFRENEMETIYRVLAAIMNLLEIEFKATLTKDNTDGAEVVRRQSGESPLEV
jgi:myosin-3